LVTDPTVSSLKMDKHHFNAVDGGKGGTNGRAGKDGRDVFVRYVNNLSSNEVIAIIVRSTYDQYLIFVRVPVGVVVRRVLDWEEMDLFDGEDCDEDAALISDDLDNDDELNASESNQEAYEESQDISDELELDVDGQNEDDSYEFEDFDTYYENLLRQNKGRRKRLLPIDYDDVVNKEVRAQDGMYHWTPPEMPDGLNDESATTAYSNQTTGRKSIFVADLDKPKTSLLIAKGGKAGVGNQAYANRQHIHSLNAHAAQKSRPGEGEITHLELELKLIADVGLVGFPNAGKSSLLSAMSRARPKIASYPFTTLHPLVGTIHYKDEYKIVMADVPGLIDGAAEGRGRGVEFLRHIERTKALVYIVDAASVDGRCPVSDLRILGKELKEYGSSGYFKENELHIDDEIHENYEEEMKRRRREIMSRPSLILANKMDLIPANDANLGRREELLFQLALAAEEVGIVCERDNILGISAGVTGEGLHVLSKQLRSVLNESL
jgi:Obg family GTPase CgtA